MLESVKPVLSVAALLGTLAFPFAAGAQTPAPADPAPADPAPADPAASPDSSPPTINLTQQQQPQSQQPTIDLAVPPPPPPVTRQFQQHEGFYARVNLGLGTLLSSTVDFDAAGEAETGGLTLNYDLLLGGSPSPGFIIGGGVLGGMQLSGDWEFDGTEVDGSGDMTTFLIGPFVDAYPQPNGGLHFGGLLGLGYAAVEPPGPSDSEDAIGIGGAVWGGHDVWVAPEWSVGGQLRLDVLRASGSDPDFTVTNIGLTLSFTVVYN